MPELVVGVLVVALFSLGAVMWHLRSVDRSPALAVVGTVERGETITAADVRVVYVSSDDPVARLGESERAEVVGKVALVDLAPGTLLSRSLVADRPELDEGGGIVGLSLEPGGYPALGLAPGDTVDVVRSVDPSEPVTDEKDNESAPVEAVVARAATVVAVEELSSDRLLVSVLTSESDAVAVAARSGSGSLQLVQVTP